MYFPYFGCLTSRSMPTTIVLRILSLVTRPTTVFLFRFSHDLASTFPAGASAPARCAALAREGSKDLRDRLPVFFQLRRVLELLDHALVPKVVQLLAVVRELLLQRPRGRTATPPPPPPPAAAVPARGGGCRVTDKVHHRAAIPSRPPPGPMWTYGFAEAGLRRMDASA